MNYIKMMLLVVGSLVINTVLKGMELEKYIPEDKIFVGDYDDNYNYKPFRLCNDGSELVIAHEALPESIHKFYCAKVVTDQNNDKRDIFIKILGESNPGCSTICSRGKYSRLPITLTEDQLKKMKSLTKKTEVIDNQVIDDLGKDVVVFDNLNNLYRIVGVRRLRVKK